MFEFNQAALRVGDTSPTDAFYDWERNCWAYGRNTWRQYWADGHVVWTPPHNDPGLRRRVNSEPHGIKLLMTDELPAKLRTPDGRVVKRSWIAKNQYVYDTNHKRVLLCHTLVWEKFGAEPPQISVARQHIRSHHIHVPMPDETKRLRVQRVLRELKAQHETATKLGVKFDWDGAPLEAYVGACVEDMDKAPMIHEVDSGVVWRLDGRDMPSMATPANMWKLYTELERFEYLIVEE